MKQPDSKMSPGEVEAVLTHIDRALAVFDGCEAGLSPLEVRAKSMLSVLRHEIHREYAIRSLDARDITATPWPKP